MSDRYYNQMRDATGWCHGMPEYLKNKRRRRMAWTDESKAEAVEMYVEQEPTPETSMEVVKDIAEHLGESPNGVSFVAVHMGYVLWANCLSHYPYGRAKRRWRINSGIQIYPHGNICNYFVFHYSSYRASSCI